MIGIGIAVVFVLLVLFMRGGAMTALFDLHALLVVVGGAFAAAAITFPIATILRMPRMVFLAGAGHMLDLPTVAAQLIKAADRVRMNGPATGPTSRSSRAWAATRRSSASSAPWRPWCRFSAT